MSKKFIRICADDYGLTQGINQAVINLFRSQAINCTSCMTEAPQWLNYSAPRLQEYIASDTTIEVGIHLNLTENFRTLNNKYTLGQILKNSYSKNWSIQLLESELQRQCEWFEQGLKQAPRFIDGHQHIHQFPIIRDLVVKISEVRYANTELWIRNTLPSKLTANPKTHVLTLLGGRTLKQQLIKQAIKTNEGFLGVYNFSGDYQTHMSQWLEQAQENSLIMCHPSTVVDVDDGIGAQRVKEYEFLVSDAFQNLLSQHGLTLKPMQV
ncbi:ChbG/HpnK family deacetylase [Thiolinea disciformis]|uniref:ChbG/HpnK family deacetylase n=1 Tax=Thiolinea disciformis TaxID=125614 RepID=UPI00037D9FED|nr:ChbG/HpnK family deacetylase [Thiolinea disciformis]